MLGGAIQRFYVFPTRCKYCRRLLPSQITRDRGEWQDDYLDEFARSWSEVVQLHLVDLARFASLMMDAAAVAGPPTTALVATGRGKNIQVMLIQIGIEDGRIKIITPHRISPEVCPPCVPGRSEIVTEFLGLTTERARVEAERLAHETNGLSNDEREARWMIRLVDLTIKLLPDTVDVGGPIDALELRTGEPLRWIQRKSEYSK